MAKKKRARRTAKRSSRKVRKVLNKKVGLVNKIKLVVNNLLLFIALSLVSLVLKQFIQSPILNQLFFITAIVFGFISVGFLITLLILAIMKMVSKRR